MKIVRLAELLEVGVSHNPQILKKVMIQQGQVPNLTNFSQFRAQPGQISPGHSHQDMVEVFLVESGHGQIEIDGQRFKLSPGVCVQVDINEQHEISNTGDQELVVTYFGIQVGSVG